MDRPQNTTADFLGLARVADSGYEFVVGEDLLNSGGTLWGGVGLAAFVAGAEQTVGRRCVWGTVQYLVPIRAGARVRMDVTVGGEGVALTQASAVWTVAGQPALMAIGTFGGDGPHDLQFSAAPDVPEPLDCHERRMPEAWGHGIIRRIEQRSLPGLSLPAPDGRPGTGRTMMWMRLREPVAPDLAALAVLADMAPSGISEALGRPTFGSSLDNSIRAARSPEPDSSGWVLLDITVEAIAGKVAQLSARMFDEQRRLLAVAGQSSRLRRAIPPR
jgi:acyl-CoA thioesterase II